MKTWLWLSLVVALGACSGRPSASEEKPTPAREVVSGSGRLRGNGVHMDVSVGGAFAATAMKNAAATAKPNKAVTP